MTINPIFRNRCAHPPRIFAAHAFHLPLALVALIGASAWTSEDDVRIVPQLAVGSSGFEPGLALEWRGPSRQMIVRPEVFISEDGRIGAGGAILFDATAPTGLSSRHAVAVGPRVVYHHSDETSWEADVMGLWSYDLGSHDAWRHSVGVLGALGVRREKQDKDNAFGGTVGIFYAYRL